MKSTKSCSLCFVEFIKEEDLKYSPKLSEICSKYLHSSFMQEPDVLHEPSYSRKSLFCPKCSGSAVELVNMNDQMEFYQKRISELVFLFSMEILHRRGKTSDINDKNKNNFTKKLIEIDISSFPNCETWNISSKTETSASQEQTSQLSGIIEEMDATLTGCEHTIDVTFEQIKCENEQLNEIDENKDDESINDSEMPTVQENNLKKNSTVEVENTSFPILKLRKLQFNANEKNSKFNSCSDKSPKMNQTAKRTRLKDVYKLPSEKLPKSIQTERADGLSTSLKIESKKCPLCGATFRFAYMTRRHYQQVHLKIRGKPGKKLQCELCDYWGLKSNLKVHIASKHTGISSESKPGPKPKPRQLENSVSTVSVINC